VDGKATRVPPRPQVNGGRRMRTERRTCRAGMNRVVDGAGMSKAVDDAGKKGRAIS
jgi:hypothetical protein